MHDATAAQWRQAESVRSEVLERGYRRVVLLEDEESRSRGLLSRMLVGGKVLVLTPGERDRLWLARVAREELAYGEPREQTIERFGAMMADGAEHGVDALVLADTALLPLVERAALDLPVVRAYATSGDEARIPGESLGVQEGGQA